MATLLVVKFNSEAAHTEADCPKLEDVSNPKYANYYSVFGPRQLFFSFDIFAIFEWILIENEATTGRLCVHHLPFLYSHWTKMEDVSSPKCVNY